MTMIELIIVQRNLIIIGNILVEYTIIFNY